MAATRSLSSTLQHMGRTLVADDLAGLADAELVSRFVADRDEAAFAALLRRYGPVVFGVCRRVLRHDQDAEDAFQATFIVLARNATTLRQAGSVGNWLYGVAFNVARKAKAMRKRREAKEQRAATLAPPTPVESPPEVLDDLREILDAELHSLSDKYRAAVVLCDVLGLTIQQAADEAGCLSKTLGSRLTRGRAQLAARLARRGVAVSSAALATVLAASATAAIPPRLLSSTVEVATGPPAAVAPAVANLTQGVSTVTILKSLKYVVLASCGVLLLAGFTKHVVQAHATPSSANVGGANGSSGSARSASHHDHLHHFFTHMLIQLGLGHGGVENAVAEDKKDEKQTLSGVWVRKEGEMKLDFSEKNVLTLTPHGENKVIVVQCEYTCDKEGLVKAKITGIEGTKEEAVKMIKEKLPVGTEFTFKWKAKDDAATLEELKDAKEKIDLFKSLMEGEYGKK